MFGSVLQNLIQTNIYRFCLTTGVGKTNNMAFQSSILYNIWCCLQSAVYISYFHSQPFNTFHSVWSEFESPLNNSYNHPVPSVLPTVQFDRLGAVGHFKYPSLSSTRERSRLWALHGCRRQEGRLLPWRRDNTSCIIFGAARTEQI